MIWKRSNFFTSLTNKLQESRFFHRFANSPFATKRWNESTLAAKATKNHWKKVLACFSVENHPAFAVLFVGKNVLFSLCKFQPWKSCCVLLGVVWCPGFAEAPMPSDARVSEPGNRSGWGWAAPGGCAQRKSSTSIVIAVWIGSKTKAVTVPLYS